MEQTMNIIPFQSVGQIKFGMNREEVVALFDEIPMEHKTWTGKLRLSWDGLAINFNKAGMVEEVCFVPDGKYHAFLNGKDLLADDGLFNDLKKIENPAEMAGCLIFFQSGISVTGFEGCGETTRAATVFATELIESWKE